MTCKSVGSNIAWSNVFDRNRRAHDTQLAAAVAESMKPPEFYNHGVDTSLTIDHISRRLKALEFRIADAQESVGMGQTGRISSGSPTRSFNRAATPAGNHGGGSSSRIDLEGLYLSLEEKISRSEKSHGALKSRVDGNERAIKEITKHVTSMRAAWDDEGIVKHARSSHKHPDSGDYHSEYAVLKEQQRHLQAKVKSLSSSTSRACRSLSVGVSDSQHATLLLYSWAEKVHAAFRDVSHQLNIEENICPRPQLHDTSGSGQLLDISAFLPHTSEDDM
jgi:hypothetical protein